MVLSSDNSLSDKAMPLSLCCSTRSSTPEQASWNVAYSFHRLSDALFPGKDVLGAIDTPLRDH